MPNSALWHSLNDATKAMRVSQKALLEEESSVIPQTTFYELQTQQLDSETTAPILDSSVPSRIGEIVMLSLIALGEGGPGQASPIVLRKVMDSLKVIGLEKEVRALALEAAVAAGL